MAQYLIILKVVMTAEEDDHIVHEVTEEIKAVCDPSELTKKISAKKEVCKNWYEKQWNETDCSISVSVVQVLPL